MEDKIISSADKSGSDKKKAINKAASYFSDDDSLFEFEGFEIEDVAKDVDELAKKEELMSDGRNNSDVTVSSVSEGNKPEASDGETGIEREAVVKTEAGRETDSESGIREVSGKSEARCETVSENVIERETDKEDSVKESGAEKSSDNENGIKSGSDEKGSSAYITEDADGELYEENAVKNSDADETDGSGTYVKEEISGRSDTLGQFQFSDNVVPAQSGDRSGKSDRDKDTTVYEEDSDVNENGEDVYEGEDSEEDNAFDEGIYEYGNGKADTKYALETYAYASSGESVNVEGQLHFEGTECSDESEAKAETKEITQPSGKGGGLYADSERSTELSEDESDDLYDEADLDNEIWDRAGKEEWEARESFLSYCKTLTLPQVKAVNYGNAEPQTVKSKVTSSGYRYAESERIPVFSDGMNGGADTASYAERERRYCEQRRTKREVVLREKNRSLYRAMLYTALILFTVLLLEILNFSFRGQEIMFAGIEIGLTVLGIAFVFGGFCDGVKCAVRGVFIPELLALLTVLMSLVYAFITVFVPTVGEGVVLIGLPGAAAIFLTAVYRFLMAKREKKVFDITAEYGVYTTEVRLSSFKGSPEEIAFRGYADEDSTLYKTNRIPRVDAGYNVQPIRDECFGLVKVLLICIVCAAIASGIAFGFIKRDPFFGFFGAYLLVGLGSPLCAFLSLALPRYITAGDVAEDGAAIADFDDEYRALDENVIMLREDELFPPEKVKITDTYWSNSHFLEAHLFKAAAAFKKTGGLLAGHFADIDVSGMGFREPVITDISDNGITIKVEDSLVRAGTDAYLEKHGIEIERYPDIPSKDTRVLYIANNGEFFCRIAIRFTPDERLCRKMAELRSADTLFSLKTCNPCIDSSLVFYTTGLEPELLRVVKYMVEDDVCEPDTDREGALISRTGAYGLFSALIGYKRQKKLVLLGSRVAAFSGLVGVLLALTVSLIGVKWAFISFAVLGFHAITSGTAALIGISGKKRRSKKR